MNGADDRRKPLAGDAMSLIFDSSSQFWSSPASVPDVLPSLVSDQPETDEFVRLADHVPILCWIARGDGHIAWYNRRWHEYCGSTPKAMEGWGWQDVHHPDELPRVMNAWKFAISDGKPFEMVFRLRGADGVFRPFLTRIIPLRDGSGAVARWFGVNTEVSAQLHAESAREATEAAQGALSRCLSGIALLISRRWASRRGRAAV